jgi:hypothetical protein
MCSSAFEAAGRRAVRCAADGVRLPTHRGTSMTSAAITIVLGLVLTLTATNSLVRVEKAATSRMAQYCAPLEQNPNSHRVYCAQEG